MEGRGELKGWADQMMREINLCEWMVGGAETGAFGK